MSERLKGWVYCNPTAINRREVAIQAAKNIIVAWTRSNRLIISPGKAGEVGQVWFDNGEGEGNILLPEDEDIDLGFALVDLGAEGSENFAKEIGATNTISHITSILKEDAGPDMPHSQTPTSKIGEYFPGIVIAAKNAMDRGNWSLATECISILTRIARYRGVSN